MDTTTPTPAVPDTLEGVAALADRLQVVTEDILRVLNDSEGDVSVFASLRTVLVERGKLIGQLAGKLDEVVSYREWNQLVVVHHLGAVIDARLRPMRDSLRAQTSFRERDRVLLDRIGGTLAPPEPRSSQEITV
jgi:hypothetical protein